MNFARFVLSEFSHGLDPKQPIPITKTGRSSAVLDGERRSRAALLSNHSVGAKKDRSG
jgi:hypothetical protein